MNIRIVTASAGTGKTTRLCQLLCEAVAQGSARPQAIVATTFTKQAAAELLNRARSSLLRDGQARAAEALMTARMGTVNSVCGGIVSDFAFELGLSPDLRVLDESGADLELVRSLAAAVDSASSEQLERFKTKFDKEFDWHYEVKRIIESARANGIAASRLSACAQRSIETLDACLGPTAGPSEELDASLLAAIEAALAAIRSGSDATSGTRDYVTFLDDCHRDLKRNQLCWGDWTKLLKEVPTRKSLDHATGVQQAAGRHLAHPRLREDLHTLIEALFQAAAAGMTAYQEHKRDLGLLDYVDQEVLALEALGRPDIRDSLAGKFDLVLVDEFQDTSPLQLTIFLELAKLAKESVWVGDPKQAIYGFRGTDPALMDKAIESLANPRDPEFVTAVVNQVATQQRVTTLSVSYRSRPSLVETTNEIFARAFQSQGMPEERTRVQAKLTVDPAGLGPAYAHWPLEGKYQNDWSEALSAGIAALVASKPMVRDRQTGELRPAALTDIAVLCRTNGLCGQVAEALGQQGLAAVVARVGLLAMAEAQVLLAGLQLWVDPRDRLAAALLRRILEHGEDAAAFVEATLADTESSRPFESGAAAAVLEARGRFRDLDVLGTIDAVIEATDLRRLCAEWGSSEQRTANLDAFRAHAGAYCDERRAGMERATLLGFLRYLEEMLPDEWAWGSSRTDRCALLAGQDAIRVSTWHAAKGLEWPIVVLYGLESLRPPLAYGVHVMSDGENFDLADPLAGRWIRFWPNPYTTSNQQGPVKSAYESSPAFKDVVRRSEREALRVLYVGWTRARDYLILAAGAKPGKLLGGMLRILRDIDPTLISEPVAGPSAIAGETRDVVWGGRATRVEIRRCAGLPPSNPVPQPGTTRTGRTGSSYAPARIAPSSAEPLPFVQTEVIHLGAPVRWAGEADADILGTAVHGFLAADVRALPAAEREELAAALIARYGVGAAVDAAVLVAMADRLWGWIDARFPGGRVRREWPLAQKLPSGTVMLGSADLVVEGTDHLAIVDHKSATTFEGAISKAQAYGAQLACYAATAARAGWVGPVSTWLHLPFAGKLVGLAPTPEVPVILEKSP